MSWGRSTDSYPTRHQGVDDLFFFKKRSWSVWSTKCLLGTRGAIWDHLHEVASGSTDTHQVRSFFSEISTWHVLLPDHKSSCARVRATLHMAPAGFTSLEWWLGPSAIQFYLPWKPGSVTTPDPVVWGAVTQLVSPGLHQKGCRVKFFSGPSVTYEPSVILFSHCFWHFGVLALFCTITTPPLNCGKEKLAGWKSFLKDHRQNRMVMGAAAQLGSLLRCWGACLDSTKEKSKNYFGTRTRSPW